LALAFSFCSVATSACSVSLVDKESADMLRQFDARDKFANDGSHLPSHLSWIKKRVHQDTVYLCIFVFLLDLLYFLCGFMYVFSLCALNSGIAACAKN
jgi:hypothetical protein